MQLQTDNKLQKKLLPWDWVLIIGTVISPMSEFRIWKVGPGEFLVLLWCLRYLGKLLTLSLKDIMSRFWLTFLPVIGLGTCFCLIFYKNEANPSGLTTFAFFALVSCSITVGLLDRTADQIKRLIYNVAILTAFWYLFLYFYSRYINYYFLDARLWYGGVRFTGGATNPHQLATLISSALFLNIIHVVDQSCSMKNRILPLIAAVVCFFISIQIKSSTLVVSIVFTFSIFIYYIALKRLSTKSQKWIATSVLVIFFSVLIGIFREKLFDYVFEWVESDANGLGRFEIFSSIGGTLRKNWLFGLGPGSHGMDGTIEYHNAYLEILAMGGIIGAAIFVVFSARLFPLLMTEPALLFAVVPLYIYGLGGFSLRRLCFWILISIATVYSENKKRELEEEAGSTQRNTLRLQRTGQPRFGAKP